MSIDILKNILVIKRNNRRVQFDGRKIAIAIKKGFDSTENSKYTEKEANIIYNKVLEKIKERYLKNTEEGKKIKIEEIQDIVEDILKSEKYFDVYEKYREYRENKRKIREVFDERKKYKLLGLLENVSEINKVKSDFPKNKLYISGKDVAKNYAITHKVKRKFIEQVEAGEIFIHNLEYIPSGMTRFYTN